MRDYVITDAGSLDDALERMAGAGVSVVSRRGVSGGCIANGSRVDLSSGATVFVKQSRSLPPQMFVAEAAGLDALERGGGPRVPRVFAVSNAVDESFIVMEWIEPGRKGKGFAEEFGRLLAELHGGHDVDRYGFEIDNYIGSTPQKNTWMDSWFDFFREFRIGFQTRLAREKGVIDGGTVHGIERILERLEELLPAPEHPSLLHGDLWGGNYLVDDHGAPVLIDPAVYYGHREADLAMTELFGGFSRGFFAAYRDAWPLQPGYETRVELYNLYHMLNHANLFGGSYGASVRSIVQRYR